MGKHTWYKKIKSNEEIKLYLHLEKKYPNLKVEENEDLNIERAIFKILKYCWYNIDKFKTVDEISKKVGIPSRKIALYCRQHGFTTREQLFKDKRKKEEERQQRLKKIEERNNIKSPSKQNLLKKAA